MYTWGYIKECVLSKLGMSEEEANQQNFLSQFPYYANEAMTQICSAVKPKDAFTTCVSECTGDIITMPDDFLAFSDDVVMYNNAEASDEDFEYYNYNEFICNKVGIYRIPYKARWFFFTKDLHNSTVISAPADICEAIPSYIVSQCLKLDDELKAGAYRNEFEIFLARIDNTSFKSSKSIKIGGGW